MEASTRKEASFIPIKDLLKRMWSRLESTTMLTTLMSTKFDLLTDTNENIEVSVERKRKNGLTNTCFFPFELSLKLEPTSFLFMYKAFINIYQTLWESVHNCTLRYEDDVLPIPDINGNTFCKADAIALGKRKMSSQDGRSGLRIRMEPAGKHPFSASFWSVPPGSHRFPKESYRKTTDKEPVTSRQNRAVSSRNNRQAWRTSNTWLDLQPFISKRLRSEKSIGDRRTPINRIIPAHSLPIRVLPANYDRIPRSDPIQSERPYPSAPLRFRPIPISSARIR